MALFHTGLFDAKLSFTIRHSPHGIAIQNEKLGLWMPRSLPHWKCYCSHIAIGFLGFLFVFEGQTSEVNLMLKIFKKKTSPKDALRMSK
ncbi:hypothetical protein ES288_D09G062800v1 [Gossypium darwinii]|uniref:Uncharacterized protein n=1 Tax=Gossypium darwinii TaxID=34276 RepID=A0A5D2B6B0_GOSDA|nr:hypothetical protein ES288_D09G062800v1 [Gossypium darwinii]